MGRPQWVIEDGRGYTECTFGRPQRLNTSFGRCRVIVDPQIEIEVKHGDGPAAAVRYAEWLSRLVDAHLAKKDNSDEM